MPHLHPHPHHQLLLLLLVVVVVVVSAERLSYSGVRREKAVEKSALRLSPNLLFLVLPLIIGSLILWLRWKLYRIERSRDQHLRTLKKHDDGNARDSIDDHDDHDDDVTDVFAFDKAMFPGMTPEVRMQLEAQFDPELQPIASLIGRELTLEQYGRIKFSLLTPRQLQALGFASGCPFLSCPKFQGMEPSKVARICGFKASEMHAHKLKQNAKHTLLKATTNKAANDERIQVVQE